MRVGRNLRRYLGRRDYSHLQDVDLSDFNKYLPRDRRCYLDLQYEECGSQPRVIENHRTSPQPTWRPRGTMENICESDQEFSSTEDTPVNRIKCRRRRRRRRIVKSESFLGDTGAMFTLDM